MTTVWHKTGLMDWNLYIIHYIFGIYNVFLLLQVSFRNSFFGFWVVLMVIQSHEPVELSDKDAHVSCGLDIPNSAGFLGINCMTFHERNTLTPFHYTGWLIRESWSLWIHLFFRFSDVYCMRDKPKTMRDRLWPCMILRCKIMKHARRDSVCHLPDIYWFPL